MWNGDEGAGERERETEKERERKKDRTTRGGRRHKFRASVKRALRGEGTPDMSISRGNTGRYLAGGIVKIKQTLLPLPPPPLLLLLMPLLLLLSSV